MSWTWVSTTAISIAALTISLATLWRTHLSRFRVVATAGPMNFRMHLINADVPGSKYAINFAAAFGITNAGARIGQILAVRAKIYYPHLPRQPAFETLMCVGEFDPAKYLRHSRETLSMFQEAKLGDLAPFVVLPRDTVTKYVVFRGFWNQRPVPQKWIRIHVECLTDRSLAWHRVGEWAFALREREWDELVAGSTFTSYSQQVPNNSERRPSNLSDYLYESTE